MKSWQNLTKRQKNTTIGVSLLALVVLPLAVFVIMTSMKGTTMYSVSQIINKIEAGKVKTDQSFKIAGTVKEGSVKKNSLQNEAVFLLTDKKKDIKVKYHGNIPDTFKGGVSVVAEGLWDKDKEMFLAQSMLTKCPSKYKAAKPK
ncbi:MAG: cytochrome c maturation protein CcmE [Actinobacteria bacterium]|nr:MAG: cytochrome c maturation protein CcmE [Actinomycetota bacterium]